MFKGDNKNTRTTSLTLFWCFYCHLWTYFTPFSSVFIADFEQSNVSSNVFIFKRKVLCDMFLENQHEKVIKSNLLIYQEYYSVFFFHFTHPEILHQHNGCYRKYETQHWAGMGWCSLNIWEDMEHTCARYVGRICMTIHFYVGSIFCQLNELEILLPRFRSQYLFKVNYENTRTMCEIYSKAKGMTSVTSCWCFDRYLRTYFTHFSGVSIVD